MNEAEAMLAANRVVYPCNCTKFLDVRVVNEVGAPQQSHRMQRLVPSMRFMERVERGIREIGRNGSREEQRHGGVVT